MMISIMNKIEAFFPRGSLQRFGVLGGFNTLIFLILMEILYYVLNQSSDGFVWAISWFTTSVMGHFVHRWFTFHTEESVKKTTSFAIVVYCVGMMGSTWSYVTFIQLFDINIRIIAIFNVLLWGFIVWLLMRIFVFKHKQAVMLHTTPTIREE